MQNTIEFNDLSKTVIVVGRYYIVEYMLVDDNHELHLYGFANGQKIALKYNSKDDALRDLQLYDDAVKSGR